MARVMTEFDILVEIVMTHFTPSELVEFLDIDFTALFSSDLVEQAIEDNMNELMEEIGVEDEH